MNFIIPNLFPNMFYICLLAFKIQDLKSRNWPDSGFFDGMKYHQKCFCENHEMEILLQEFFRGLIF